MQYLRQTERQLQQFIHHYSHYTLRTRDLRNHSTHTTTLQHPSCTQSHVHLRRSLTNLKDKDEPEDREAAVYKIKCSGCQATSIGETSGGVVMRALASHQCGLGSIPRLGVICGLLVLFSALRGFSPGNSVFTSPRKKEPTFDKV